MGAPQQIITEPGLDGSKIALNREGTQALVTWLRPDLYGYAVVSDLATEPPTVGAIGTIDPALIGTEGRLSTIEPTVKQVAAVQWRLTHAELCTSSRVDQVGCDPSLATGAPVVLERSPRVRGMPLLPQRPAVFVFQPAFVSGGTLAGDTRVSVFWYAQPFYGRAEYDELYRALTIIEGVSSSDGGRSYGFVQGISVPDDEIPALPFLPMIGAAQAFIPCAVRAPTIDQAYFGDYNGGAYASSSPKDQRAVASWTDSRQGCFSTEPGGKTYHHHVMGAVW